MAREYMSEEEFATIDRRELGTLGVWRILQAPDEWNDRYLWACDGYWLAPVCLRSNGAPVASVLTPEDFADMQARPEDYCLQTRFGHRFDWSRPGQVSIASAYRIPRSRRTRGAVAIA